jgi:hypothetical protein
VSFVLAALQWSYEAKATDVQEKWLEQAAELLVLRHDTFEIIDGKGPGAETEQVPVTEKEAASQIPAVPVSSPNEEQELPPSVPTEQTMQTPSRKKEEAQPAALGNCTFSGIVPIPRERFLESGVSLVECASLWESMDSFARWWSPALQIAQETENEHSQYWATMGQDGFGLECGWLLKSATVWRKCASAASIYISTACGI